MTKEQLPLKEVSIEQLFMGAEKCIYEIPIYQRNYAWEKDEITALVQDVYDAYKKNPKVPYYIGTLVSYHKGDRVFEVIDGQQRLTTILLVLEALDIHPSNRLAYRARKKSDDTLKSIPSFNVEEKDRGIENGYRHVKTAIGDSVPDEDLSGFKTYFREQVHIIHYQVPKDIDLNHYFEIMNSRGEQLEKHEIVKANLMERLSTDEERQLFNRIWESCAEMSVYVQQNLEDVKTEDIFGNTLCDFLPKSFGEIQEKYRNNKKKGTDAERKITLQEILKAEERTEWAQSNAEAERKDSFQPIIDFPNFLLIVLKISRMSEPDFNPLKFNLDDKELLNEFDQAKMDYEKVKAFAFNLLKCRFLLDNYVVHHSKEDDTLDSNPWKLQVWQKDQETRKGQLRNLSDDRHLQERMAHLLSMFEVSFTARQRKNYLFYCLLYLSKDSNRNIPVYADYLESLAERYFYEVYLDNCKLNSINTPLPGSFDEAILSGNALKQGIIPHKDRSVFITIYGDGRQASRGIPLFIFNYLDYKLWRLYDADLRGESVKEVSRERKLFFDRLGCGDFGLKLFDQFYFSRTRRSLEHYYPQANATGLDGALNEDQINCFGNYAMIGSEANSSGSNWSPKTKLDHYLDPSGKISQISVASLKFMIMMQICKDNQEWSFEEIEGHQEKMVSILIETNGHFDVGEIDHKLGN